MKRRVLPADGAPTGPARLECGHEAPGHAADGDVVDCPACDRRQRPGGLREVRRTPVFTAATTPPALRRAHLTTVWAELVVEAGQVGFHEEGPPPWSCTATAGEAVTVVPGRPHAVSPSDDARFHVRFYEHPPRAARQPASA